MLHQLLQANFCNLSNKSKSNPKLLRTQRKAASISPYTNEAAFCCADNLFTAIGKPCCRPEVCRVCELFSRHPGCTCLQRRMSLQTNRPTRLWRKGTPYRAYRKLLQNRIGVGGSLRERRFRFALGQELRSHPNSA